MNENDLAKIIINCCYTIHTTMGPGLFESVYEEILAYELSTNQLKFEKQKEFPIPYKDVMFESGFRLDFLVEKKVVVELKSVEKILPIHKKQILTYLKISNTKLGLLINFNSVLLKEGISRIVNNL